MRRWSDVIQLVSVVKGKDATGYPADTYIPGPDIFANRTSAGSGEFYRAAQAGFTVDKVFEVRLVEYGGHCFLDHEDERYEILRTYEKGETIELVCLRRDAVHGS